MSDERVEAAEAEDDVRETLDRNRDLLGRKDPRAPIRRYLDKEFDKLIKGFEEQADRSDAIDKWWNCYNCCLDDNQFYNGNAAVYVPLIRDAINARATRFVNQLFPASGRYIDCTTSDGSLPFEVLAIATHYIDAAKLKTQVIKPLLKAGDIEGQYNLYVDWKETQRQLVQKVKRGVLVPMGDEHIEAEGEEIEDIEEEDVVEGRPCFEVLHDSDVLILPQSAESVEDALARGGSVTIVRRWSKDQVEAMGEDGEIRKDEADILKDSLVSDPKLPGFNDESKALIRAIGIRSKGPHAVGLETWKMLPLGKNGQFKEGETKRLCRVYFGINRQQLGCKRNPFWNDRCPLLSVPVEKVPGVAKGKSQVEALAPLQWEANDAANERADADHYGAMPIIARDPKDNPNAPLILNLAAVWPVKPGSIQFMQFPDLSERAMSRIMAAWQAISQSLGINPAMLPQQTGRPGAKRNQAEIAMEQQVDLLTTAEAVAVVTEGICDPVVQWMVDLDHQFRDEKLTVRAYGEMGIRAAMIGVPPLQNRTRYQFSWCGGEQIKMNLAMQQQGTAFLNIVRGMQQQLQAEGYSTHIGPFLEKQALSIFGTMASSIVVDRRREQTVDAKTENYLLEQGHAVTVHPLDQDAQHIQVHVGLQQQTGDPHGNIQLHIQQHLVQLNAKNQAMLKAQLGGALGLGAPGVPGGAGPGVAGTPRMGAQPAMQRSAQQPPGALHQDRMPSAGVIQMPRKM